jgi:hypothetical protein
MHQRTQKNEIFNKDSEIYFPLSPKYLAYLHYGKPIRVHFDSG